MTTALSILADVKLSPPEGELSELERLADDLRSDAALVGDAKYKAFAATGGDSGPTLHLDDHSDVRFALRPGAWELDYRARLRAGTGDLVATLKTFEPCWEQYFQSFLNLGSPTLLSPKLVLEDHHLATTCWVDRDIRRELLSGLRRRNLHTIHPLMGSRAVWELASLLHHASRRPVSVIAPPPGLCRRVNDKVWFARLVCRLFGSRYLPPTREAANLAQLTFCVRELVERSTRVVVKVPDSAGGAGNLVLEADWVKARALRQLMSDLGRKLFALDWHGDTALQVSCWEQQVIAAPSAQTWIPPYGQGPPRLDGLFLQVIHGSRGGFAGYEPAQLPERATTEIADHSLMLALLFQKLGYVGRCSFDTLLLGSGSDCSLDNARVEFIECNGRWGGTSLPMHLMERLFGDWTGRPHALRHYALPSSVTGWDQVFEGVEADLYDVRTGRGNLILCHPSPTFGRRAVAMLVLADSWSGAAKLADEELPGRLAGIG